MEDESKLKTPMPQDNLPQIKLKQNQPNNESKS
jgi:hypothetical protein